VFNYKFDWSVITSGKYAGWLVEGFYTTLQLSVVSIALAFLLALSLPLCA
jgi:polar amino acid transport system permease protein